MTTELFYLALTSLLLANLWIPYIAATAGTHGLLKPEEYRTLRHPTEGLLDWGRRANRAHLNLVEQFGAFAGLVIVAHLAGISTPLTAGAAAVFFWSRLAHAVVMILGVSALMIRTVIFNISWLALLTLAWAIFTAPASG